jgi:hypothetical protein
MAISGGNQYSAVNLSSAGGRAGVQRDRTVCSPPAPALLRRPLLRRKRKANWKLRMEFDFHIQDRRVE